MEGPTTQPKVLGVLPSGPTVPHIHSPLVPVVLVSFSFFSLSLLFHHHQARKDTRKGETKKKNVVVDGGARIEGLARTVIIKGK